MDGNTTCHASCASYIGEVERNNQIRKKIADSHEEFRYRYDRFGRISDGDTKYTLYAEPVSYDSFATQTNGTINFDLVSDEPPKVTFHQWKLIRAMERELGIAFTGTTIVDAQEFISENIDEFNRLHDEENLTVSKDIYEL